VVRLGTAVVAAALALVIAPPLRAQPAAEVRLEDAHRRLVIRIEPRGANFLLWDGDGTPLGELAVEADRVLLRDATGALKWTLRRKDFGPQIDSGAGERLYRLRKRTDEWRLENAAKEVVARIRQHDGEAEIRDTRGAMMLTVKRTERGYVFATEPGHRVAEVAGAGKVGAGLWFGVERFSPAERAALWAYFANLDR
jgi:hypothetical protein